MKKKTALYDEHVKLGGRIVDFGGWELPVQYTGVIDEHLNCRENAGLFDVSHMGEITVVGKNAEAFVNLLVTNDVTKIENFQAQYSALCNDQGGIVDDLVIYKKNSESFFIVVNASNTDKDFSWINSVYLRFKNDFKDLKITNESSEWSQIALQGPKAKDILQQITDLNLTSIKTYWFNETNLWDNIPVIIARTGYTGEDGFEIYVPWKEGPRLWNTLLEKGRSYGLKPCGLAARDTLRLEMKYALYGHELSDDTNPLETGLAWVTKLNKLNFIGKDALVKIKENGIKKALIGIEFLGKGIPRQNYPVFDSKEDRQIGLVTSGTQSPITKKAIAVASIEKAWSQVGTELRIQIRGEYHPAVVVNTPFIKRNSQ